MKAFQLNTRDKNCDFLLLVRDISFSLRVFVMCDGRGVVLSACEVSNTPRIPFLYQAEESNGWSAPELSLAQEDDLFKEMFEKIRCRDLISGKRMDRFVCRPWSPCQLAMITCTGSSLSLQVLPAHHAWFTQHIIRCESIKVDIRESF